MPKKQSRRSVSMKPIYYVRLKAHAAKVGKSASDVVQKLLDAHLGPPTPEDFQKLGEFLEKIHKETPAAETAPESHDKPQEPSPEPELPRTVPAPAEPTVEPVVEAAPPEPTVEVIEQQGELPPATRELRHGFPPRRLSKGEPIEPVQKPEPASEEPEGFEDYTPPILNF